MLYNVTFSAKHHRCLPLCTVLFSRPSCIFYAFNCGLDTVVEVIALPVHSPSPWVEILVCLLLEVLTGCSSLGVYACDAISSINDRAKLMPDKLYVNRKSLWLAFGLFLLKTPEKHPTNWSIPLYSSVHFCRRKECRNGMHLIRFKCFLSLFSHFRPFLTLLCLLAKR